MMKYIHTIALFAALLIAFTSCSPDIEEDEAIVAEEQLPPEPTSLYQVPHWSDGTITIRTGVYETGREMEDAIWDRENFHAYSVSLRIDIRKIPRSNVKKEVEVTVLTLREVGIKSFSQSGGFVGFRSICLQETRMCELLF